MLQNRRLLLPLILILLAGVIGWLAGTGALTDGLMDGLKNGPQAGQGGLQAQSAAPDEDLYALLKRLDAENQPWTLHFAVPLDTGDRSHTMTSSGAVIGRDYFCYGEPWNSATRYHCTPFTNIVSVTFED